MENVIGSPTQFLESLIRDTWEDIIFWDSYVFDYGKRHLALVNIPGTKKYLKIELFEMGKSSFIRVDFHTGPNDKIRFDNIKYKNQVERMQRLLLAIKRQQEI